MRRNLVSCLCCGAIATCTLAASGDVTIAEWNVLDHGTPANTNNKSRARHADGSRDWSARRPLLGCYLLEQE